MEKWILRLFCILCVTAMLCGVLAACSGDAQAPTEGPTQAPTDDPTDGPTEGPEEPTVDVGQDDMDGDGHVEIPFG